MGTHKNSHDSDQRTPWDKGLLRLYTTHFAALVSSAERILRCRMTAEEAVQDAFVQFHLSRTKPRIGSELSYVRSIALNNARTVLRRATVAESRSRAEVPQSLMSVEDCCVRNEDVEVLTAALQELSVRQREVVWLRHAAGLSEQETAAQLDIGEGSVKTHAWRARAALRDAMSARMAA